MSCVAPHEKEKVKKTIGLGSDKKQILLNWACKVCDKIAIYGASDKALNRAETANWQHFVSKQSSQRKHNICMMFGVTMSVIKILRLDFQVRI